MLGTTYKPQTGGLGPMVGTYVPGGEMSVPPIPGGAAGGTYMAYRPGLIKVGESGTEMVSIRPFVTNPIGLHKGGGGGTPLVQVFLDGRQISGYLVSNITDQLHLGRNR